MKIVVFFSILFIGLTSSLKAKEVFIIATANIFYEDKDRAKKQALKNAIFDSVKHVVENLLDKSIINNHYGVIQKKIYKFNDTFINNYEVLNLEEIVEENMYKISVNVDVNIEKIKKKLKLFRILKEKQDRKKILVVYSSSKEYLLYNNNFLIELLNFVNKSFAKYSFRVFEDQNLKNIFSYIKEEGAFESSIDSFIALALIKNADILVIMGLNANQTEKIKKSFYKISTKINLSIYDSITGQQITETSVTSNLTSIKELNNSEKINLSKKISLYAAEENVRQAVNKINNFYNNLLIFGNEYSVVFKDYFPEQENLIIEYFENNLDFKKISEIKNLDGYLELELFYKKRKSVLRRKIIRDLLKQEIEVATKSLAGNRLIFLNPNLDEESERFDNNSTSTAKN